MNALEQLVKNDVKLPSPPGIALRIIEMVKREDFVFNQLAAVIQSDPALAAKILRLVNSGYYAVSQSIGHIDRAVGLLGVNAVKNIALSFTIPGMFKGSPSERFDFDRFWRRSAVTAVAADLISAKVKLKTDDTFITALLQDLGVATMYTCRRADYLRVLDRKAVTQLPVTAIEDEIFGFNHQEVGASLLQNWGLPERVYQPIRYHHNAEGAPAEFKQVCSLLRIADRISAGYHGTDRPKNIREAQGMLSSIFHFSEAEVSAVIDAVAETSIALLTQFEIDAAQMKPFSQILQEANAELSRLNLSYEMLVMEYKHAKEKADRLTLELQAANDNLRDLAFRDGLTGLYNHRYFQETMAKEISRANRYGRPLAIIMLDIDHFKNINDTYGHQGGDLVLQAISRLLEQTTRKSDIVARYGGEEFVLVLPETNLQAALTKAENCRSAVETLEMRTGDTVLRATVSAGVAAYDPSRPVTKDELVAAADQALYKSKREGRNRVSTC
jgi:diguanylate cyclase (GGDEF)-like protein